MSKKNDVFGHFFWTLIINFLLGSMFFVSFDPTINNFR